MCKCAFFSMRIRTHALVLISRTYVAEMHAWASPYLSNVSMANKKNIELNATKWAMIRFHTIITIIGDRNRKNMIRTQRASKTNVEVTNEVIIFSAVRCYWNLHKMISSTRLSVCVRAVMDTNQNT